MPMKRRRHAPVGTRKHGCKPKPHKTATSSPRGYKKQHARRLCSFAVREQNLIDRHKRPDLYGLTPEDRPKLKKQIEAVRSEALQFIRGSRNGDLKHTAQKQLKPAELSLNGP